MVSADGRVHGSETGARAQRTERSHVSTVVPWIVAGAALAAAVVSVSLYTYERLQRPADASSLKKSLLVGKWRSIDGKETMEFYPEGNFRTGTGQNSVFDTIGTYHLDGPDRLRLNGAIGGSIFLRIEALSANELRLSGAGETSTYHRQ